jgi:hypothetical protein
MIDLPRCLSRTGFLLFSDNVDTKEVGCRAYFLQNFMDTSAFSAGSSALCKIHGSYKN